MPKAGCLACDPWRPKGLFLFWIGKALPSLVSAFVLWQLFRNLCNASTCLRRLLYQHWVVVVSLKFLYWCLDYESAHNSSHRLQRVADGNRSWISHSFMRTILYSHVSDDEFITSIRRDVPHYIDTTTNGTSHDNICFDIQSKFSFIPIIHPV